MLPGCVDEEAGGAPVLEAEEDEGVLGADEPGLVLAIDAGAVDGEVGDARRVDEPEGYLHGLAVLGAAPGGGRVPVRRYARRLAEDGRVGEPGGRRGGGVEGQGGERHGCGG